MKILFSINLSFVANIASVLTAFIALIFYLRSLRKEYYLNEVNGSYKIFDGLRNKENTTILYSLKIVHVSPTGWFFGSLDYGDVFNDLHLRTGGTVSVFGKINYSYFRIVTAFIWRSIRLKSFHPLQLRRIDSFLGKLFILSRNDLNIVDRDWKEMLIKEYKLRHYRYANRIQLTDPTKKETPYLLPDDLLLINVDKVPDTMYNIEVTF